MSSLQPIPVTKAVIPVQTTSIATLPSASIMTLPTTDVFSLPSTSIGFPQPNLDHFDMVHAPIDTFYPIANRTDDNEALSRIPINVANLEFLKTKVLTIDTDVPRTLQMITPDPLANYYEHYYGNVTVDYLEPNELTLSVPAELDKRILPIELGRNTTLDFIGFDEGMAYIVTNGTSPENVVIAENMADEDIGYSVLLSLNNNSEQNVELIQSSNIEPTQLSIDIPFGLSPVEVGQIITDITEKTETIQIVSPDFVTETSSNDQTIVELGWISDLIDVWYGSKQSYLSERFGGLSKAQIRNMLKNPVLHKELVQQVLSKPQSDDFSSGTLFLTIHGKMMGYTLVDVDCTGIEQLSFIGRKGVVLSTSSDKIQNFAHQKANVSFYPTRQTSVGKICRVPELKFNADPHGNKNDVFGMFHTSDQKENKPVLTNKDMLTLYGKDDITLSEIINLAIIISGGSQNVKLDIAACMLVMPENRGVELTDFRISDKPEDIPYYFNYQPPILKAIEVERVPGLAPDRFCRVGAEQKRGDADIACLKHLMKRDAEPKRLLDPNLGLSGEGIREALSNEELIPDVYVVFRNEEKIRADHFNLLLKWYQEGKMELLFQEFQRDIGLDKKISLSHIIPELNEVLRSFPPDTPFIHFLARLRIEIISNLPRINRRV